MGRIIERKKIEKRFRKTTKNVRQATIFTIRRYSREARHSPKLRTQQTAQTSRICSKPLG